VLIRSGFTALPSRPSPPIEGEGTIDSSARGSTTTGAATNERRARTNHRIPQYDCRIHSSVPMGIRWTETNTRDCFRARCMTCDTESGRNHHLHTRTLLPSSKHVETRCRRTKNTSKKQKRVRTTSRSSERHNAQKVTTTSQPVRGTQRFNSEKLISFQRKGSGHKGERTQGGAGWRCGGRTVDPGPVDPWRGPFPSLPFPPERDRFPSPRVPFPSPLGREKILLPGSPPLLPSVSKFQNPHHNRTHKRILNQEPKQLHASASRANPQKRQKREGRTRAVGSVGIHASKATRRGT